MVIRAKNKNETGKWDGAAEHGVAVCYFIEGGLGSPLLHSDISTQMWRTWECESCGYAGKGRAFQNKNYETGEFIMCSRKSKDQCCWEGRVVWGARSSMVLEGTLSAGFQLPYEKPWEGFQREWKETSYETTATTRVRRNGVWTRLASEEVVGNI